MDDLAEKLLKTLEYVFLESVFGVSFPINALLGSGLAQYDFTPPYQECLTFAEKIGSRIRFLRYSRGMSQKRLAIEMNVDAATISRHERGQNLTIDMLSMYAKVMNVDVNDLLTEEKKQEYLDEKQKKIEATIKNFQQLHDLPDEKLDEVLSIVESTIKLALS